MTAARACGLLSVSRVGALAETPRWGRWGPGSSNTFPLCSRSRGDNNRNLVCHPALWQEPSTRGKTTERIIALDFNGQFPGVCPVSSFFRHATYPKDEEVLVFLVSPILPDQIEAIQIQYKYKNTKTQRIQYKYTRVRTRTQAHTKTHNTCTPQKDLFASTYLFTTCCDALYSVKILFINLNLSSSSFHVPNVFVFTISFLSTAHSFFLI